MSFDTKSGNTGRLKGVLFEERLGHELLCLACRHHILEIILAKVFNVCCGPSSSPDIPIFKRFKAVWDGVTRVNYCALELEAGAKDVKVEATVTFLQTMLCRTFTYQR